MNRPSKIYRPPATIYSKLFVSAPFESQFVQNSAVCAGFRVTCKAPASRLAAFFGLPKAPKSSERRRRTTPLAAPPHRAPRPSRPSRPAPAAPAAYRTSARALPAPRPPPWGGDLARLPPTMPPDRWPDGHTLTHTQADPFRDHAAAAASKAPSPHSLAH